MAEVLIEENTDALDLDAANKSAEVILEDELEETLEETDVVSTADKGRIAELEAEAAQLKSQMAPYAELLSKFQQEEAEKQEATIKAVVDSIPGKENLSDGDKLELTAVIREGVAYRQQKEQIGLERASLHAMAYAMQVVGTDATVSQFMETAKDILSVGDVRLMAKYVGILKAKGQVATTQARKATAQARKSIDTVVTSPAQSGLVNSISALEGKLARTGDLSNKESAELTRLYRARDGR